MSTPTTHELSVKGMSCQHCVKAVTQAIQAQDTQAEVKIDLATCKVVANTSLSREATAKAIRDEGYEVLA
jgi:copper chaperone